MKSDTIKGAKQFSFQAEVSRLLELMVHSVYTEKDVFLRELISNASDACDKLRYASVTTPKLLGDDPNFRITIKIDKENKTLSISDNGVGMSRKELVDNLGTIARSGTKAFLDKFKSKQDGAQLIGQFGVGFYSAFMVAGEVRVTSRKAGAANCYVWVSDGISGYSVSKLAKEKSDAFERGTEVLLVLKDDANLFLDELEIERAVRAYSDHISFPIELMTATGCTPKQLNTASALWIRPKSDIKEDEYLAFYRHVSVPFDHPALTIHYHAEGRHEYTVLLFVPSMRPFDLYEPSRKGRVRLYVRRVFITDEAHLLPAYLRFMRGVIDSQDMPLNISREMLQNNPFVDSIRKAVTNRSLSELKKCAQKDRNAFLKIWEAFGPALKEGIYEDPERRDTLLEIAQFQTTASENWRTLKEYIQDMRENQTVIYYLAGESLSQLKASPQLEGYRARGIEVLLLTDPVDNFWVTNVSDFEGTPFQSVTQGDTDLSVFPLLNEDQAPKEAQKTSPEMAALLVELKKVFGDTVSDVRTSVRLVESPACFVAPQEGPDRALDKLLSRQDKGESTAPILEINASHPLTEHLEKTIKKSSEVEFIDLAWLLLDQARIMEGDQPHDPTKFAERLNRYVLAALEKERTGALKAVLGGVGLSNSK